MNDFSSRNLAEGSDVGGYGGKKGALGYSDPPRPYKTQPNRTGVASKSQYVDVGASITTMFILCASTCVPAYVLPRKLMRIRNGNEWIEPTPPISNVQKAILDWMHRIVEKRLAEQLAGVGKLITPEKELVMPKRELMR